MQRHRAGALIRGGIVGLAVGLVAGPLGTFASVAAGAATTYGPGSVAAGGAHACAVAPGQSVKCWGYNESGQLGIGHSGAPVKKPVAVVGLKGVTAVTAGTNHSCALSKPAGTVSCWGLNSAGQLGNGTRTNKNKPVSVTGLRGVIAIAAAQNHTCALLAVGAGTVKCWGQNNSGVLGNGSTTRFQALRPESVNGLTRVSAISTSTNDTCALLKGGTLKCWGFNQYGELGPGTHGPESCETGEFAVACSTKPLKVAGIANVVSVSVRPHSTCAAVKNGRVLCWGLNISPGSVEAKGFVLVNGLSGVTSVGSPGDVEIFGEGEFSCAVLATKAVKCWGDNSRGQHGNGTTAPSKVPTSVHGLKLASSISGGSDFSCARTTLGPVLCWGDNGYGQLGNNGAPSHHMAVFATGLL